MPTKANKLKAESKKRVKAANTRRPNWIDSFARQAGVACWAQPPLVACASWLFLANGNRQRIPHR